MSTELLANNQNVEHEHSAHQKDLVGDQLLSRPYRRELNQTNRYAIKCRKTTE
jgi:hypothetical protein